MTEAKVTCARCGQANPAAAKFCLECGSPLGVTPARRAREERKVVSVLFADLVDFTAQAERMDPEEVRALLQPYHASLREELERYGGTVEKFIGDAVMALFGAPVAHEDDAERAVRAALAIRDSLRGDGRLHVRIGITTGEALVAVEARPESGEGMAAGDVVNTAARLQAAAPVDGILVDEATHRATRRVVEYVEHPPLTVKGKVEPVVVHEAVAARSRYGVDVRQIGQAPLVGRAREMDLVASALARALDERTPQLVTLVGVPGIGKSRIVWELFQLVDAGSRLVTWRQGRCLPYAESISYWALGEIVKAEAGILETDDPAAAAVKLRAAIEAAIENGTETEWIERHLRPLIGVEAGTELRGDHRGEAFAAWRHYLEAMADRRPMVLVLEDLHWADDGLLDFVDHLVDWVTGVPLLVVASGRPELLARRPGWGGGKPNALTISLSPLSESETGALVASLIERAVVPDSMREELLERAQGNPLYAEEFARLVAEGRRLDELPDTVQGIIAARLDGLSRQEKELLQDAAVVGKVFWSGALVSMRGVPRQEVEQVLHVLERREFVRRDRRSSVEGETEYAFRHILVRDVAYGQIPRAERGERHVLAAQWIESLGRPADHAELLAQHYVSALELTHAAGRPTEAYAARARSALREAGDRALALYAFAAAARYFKSALELMAQDDPDRPVVLFNYGKALRVSEEAGADVLAEAEQSLRTADNLELAAEAAVLQAELAWFGGRGEQVSEHLARASELVDRLKPSFSKAYVLSDLARYHMLSGDAEVAIDKGRQALQIAEAMGFDEIRAHVLNNVGTARTTIGDLDGIRDLEAAIEIAAAINAPEEARALNNLAAVLSTLGELKRARELQRAAFQRARELGNRSVERFTQPLVVAADYDEGAWDQATEALDEFIRQAEEAGGHAQESAARYWRGRILLARGQPDQAFADARLGLASARRAGDPQSLGPALSMMVAVLIELGRPAEVESLLAELLEIAKVGDYVGVDLCLALLATGRLRELEHIVESTFAGRWQEALRLIAQARLPDAADLLDEMGVPAHAALVRLHAARRLIDEQRPVEAQEQLDRAISFWQRVGATRYLQQAEELRAAVAGVRQRPLAARSEQAKR